MFPAQYAVAPPLVTPFTADGEVAVAALETLVERCLDAGLDGVVPCGTTGEFASLSDSERAIVVETAADAAGDATVVAGVADTSVAGVTRRLERAEEAGADAGLVPPPYFHGPNDPAGVEAFLRSVADDSPLALYLYDIPSCTGTALDAETVLSLADHDAVAGLKDSSGDFSGLLELLRRTPAEFDVVQGVDDQFVPAVERGADGAINALSQAIPEVYVAVRDAVAAGDEETAHRLQASAIAPLFAHCYDHGFAPVTKAAVAARGWLPGDDVRPPLVGLDEDARAAVAEAVDAALETV
ncbi:MAG: dihydrodipicolinate synthase family protein [Halolamina sp.]